MRYQGGAFHSSLDNGRSPAEAYVLNAHLVVEAAHSVIEMPCHGLHLKLGGANNTLVFFSHPLQPEWSFYTSDLTILDDPALRGNSDIILQIQGLKSHHRRARHMLVGVIMLLLLTFVGLYVQRDFLARMAAHQVPASWEDKLGDTVFAQLTLGKKFILDDRLLHDLSLITDPVVNAAEDKRYSFDFHIVEDASLNAFAIPGGHVVIHTGILLAAERPEEIAGVLAHEIAHVTQQHSVRQLIAVSGVVILIQTILGDFSGLLAVVAGGSQFLLTQKFSRDFEREADDVGWKYLLAANLDPRGMIEMFRRLEKEQQAMMKDTPLEDVSVDLSFLSTHPNTEERIEVLERKLAPAPPNSTLKIDIDWDAFQAMVRSSLGSEKMPEDSEKRANPESSLGGPATASEP